MALNNYPTWEDTGWDWSKFQPWGSQDSGTQIVGYEYLYPYTTVDAMVSAMGSAIDNMFFSSGGTGCCWPIVTAKGQNIYGTCPGNTTSVVYFILPDDLANNNFGLYIKYPKVMANYNVYAYKGGSKLTPIWTGANSIIAKVGNIGVNGTYSQSLYRPLFCEVPGSYPNVNRWDNWYDYPVQRGEIKQPTSPYHGSSRNSISGKYIAQVQIVLGVDEAFSGAAPYGYALAYVPPIYGFYQEHEVTDTIMGPSNGANIDVTIKGRSGDANNFTLVDISLGNYYKDVDELIIGKDYSFDIPYGEQFIPATSQFQSVVNNKISVELIKPRTMNPKSIDADFEFWIPYATGSSHFIFYNSNMVGHSQHVVFPSKFNAFPGLGYIDSGNIQIEQYSMELIQPTARKVDIDIEDITFYADPNDRPVLTSIKVGKVDFRNHHHEMMLCGDKKDMYRIEVEGTAAYGGGMCNIYMGGVRVGTCAMPGYIEFTGFSVVPFSEGVNGDISAQAYDMKGFLSTGQLSASEIYLVDQLGIAINIDKPTVGVTYQKPYLYKYPNAKITNIWRATSNGTEDLEEGTYAYIQGSYTGFTKNNCKLTVKLVSQTQTLLNQEVSSEGSFTNVYGTYDADHNWTFTLSVTDVFGGVSQVGKSIFSAECFMDFRAGGKGLGIGMAAQGDNRVDIKWPIYAHGGIVSSATDTILSAQEISYLESADSITLKQKLDQMDATDESNATAMTNLQNYVNANAGAQFQHVGNSSLYDFILISLGTTSTKKLAVATIKNLVVNCPTGSSGGAVSLTAPWDSKGYKTVYPVWGDMNAHTNLDNSEGVSTEPWNNDNSTNDYSTYRCGTMYQNGSYSIRYQGQWPTKDGVTSGLGKCYVSGMLVAVVEPK